MLAIIKQVSVFIICAQMILHFKAEQKYGKYLKLLIGVMVLVQLFVPLMSILGQGEKAFTSDLAYYMNRLVGSAENTTDSVVADEADFTDLQMQEIKSIFNNMQIKDLEGQMQGEGERMEEGDGQAISPEVERPQTEETDTEIIIERIEVKPDAG